MRENFCSDPGLTKHPAPRGASYLCRCAEKRYFAESAKHDLAFVRAGFTISILYEGKFLREENRNVKIKKRSLKIPDLAKRSNLWRAVLYQLWESARFAAVRYIGGHH